ncbi:MAG: SMI1/KNR4 family protein, partial [Bryobacterales bacterium]|nr:SMI1/KNR4 family protein [Bryobacterales bacterium]
HDGQHQGEYGLIFGLELMTLGRIKREWTAWKRDARSHGPVDCQSPGVVRAQYHNPKWIPFTSDREGNHLVLDLDPDEHGSVGQVIVVGRASGQRRRLTVSFDAFVARYVDHLRTVDWQIESGLGWSVRNRKLAAMHYHDWPVTKTHGPAVRTAPGLFARVMETLRGRTF